MKVRGSKSGRHGTRVAGQTAWANGCNALPSMRSHADWIETAKRVNGLRGPISFTESMHYALWSPCITTGRAGRTESHRFPVQGGRTHMSLFAANITSNNALLRRLMEK